MPGGPLRPTFPMPSKRPFFHLVPPDEPCSPLPATCEPFLAKAWRPHRKYLTQHLHPCWAIQMDSTALGIGDILSMVVPVMAQAVAVGAALEVRVFVDRNTSRLLGANRTVFEQLGFARLQAPASCKREAINISSDTAREISRAWRSNGRPAWSQWVSQADALGPRFDSHVRSLDTVSCLLRMLLSCPRAETQRLVDGASAQLPKRGWTALHARLASAAYSTEGALMRGLNAAHAAAAPRPASRGERSSSERIAHFDRFLTTALPLICERSQRALLRCGGSDLLTAAAAASAPLNGSQRIGCPVLCARVKGGRPPGLEALLRHVELRGDVAPGERLFFSTDSSALQRFVQRHMEDRLVVIPGFPAHSAPDWRLHQFDPPDAGPRAMDTKVAADYLMFMGARQTFQLAGSTFSRPPGSAPGNPVPSTLRDCRWPLEANDPVRPGECNTCPEVSCIAR